MNDDSGYHRRRAMAERARAAEAVSPELARLHERLAELHESCIGPGDYGDGDMSLASPIPLQAASRTRH